MSAGILNAWLRLLYPPKCIFCRRLLRGAQVDICSECRQALPAGQVPERTGEFFTRCICAYSYDGAVRESIHRYKFSGLARYAEGYGRMLAMVIAREQSPLPELVTWVPVSRKRRRKRGYDQAQLLAQTVAGELGLPLISALSKLRDNPPQSAQPDAAHRRGNVIGVFACADAQAVRGRRILLIDDIITTGATLSECSRVLLSAGAEEIICGALAAANQRRQVTT